MTGGVQEHKTGQDISSTGVLFTLPLHGAEALDIYVDGDAAANYAIRAGPSENDIFRDNVIELTGGTDYSNIGNRIAAAAIEVRVTQAAGATDTADVYVAAR